jgi:hypothetical protein
MPYHTVHVETTSSAATAATNAMQQQMAMNAAMNGLVWCPFGTKDPAYYVDAMQGLVEPYTFEKLIWRIKNHMRNGGGGGGSSRRHHDPDHSHNSSDDTHTSLESLFAYTPAASYRV